MTGPNGATAAHLLLTSGTVEIITRGPRRVEAEVQGRSGERRLVTHNGRCWSCTCPAWFYGRRCAHVDAVRLVAAEPGLRRLRPIGGTASGSPASALHPR